MFRDGLKQLKAVKMRHKYMCTLALFTFSFAFHVPTAATSYDNAQTCGEASWYGEKFAGQKTASGRIFDPNAMVAAHRTLAFGTQLSVMNTSNQVRIEVTIVDRGPYVDGRIIDLSRAAAEKLGFLSKGFQNVCFNIEE